MIWVEFTDAWHDAACRAQGVPKPGENAKTRDVALNAQWTTAVYQPVDDAGMLKALVSEEDAATYGLETVKAPVFPAPGDTKPGPAPVSRAKAVPTDKAEVAAVLVDRGIRTKTEAAALLKVSEAEIDAKLPAKSAQIGSK